MMKMIDVLKRLAELDSDNPNVENKMTQEQALITVTNTPGSKQINECGVMGMTSPGSTIPASANFSAGSGPELSGMLRDIMSLAGLKPASQEPAFAGSMSPTPHSVDGIGDTDGIDLEPPHNTVTQDNNFDPVDDMSNIIGTIDKLNTSDGDEESDEEESDEDDVFGIGNTGSNDSDNDVFGIGSGTDDSEEDDSEKDDSEEDETDEGSRLWDTSPDEKIEPHTYGNKDVTPKPEEPAKKNGGGNPYTKIESASMDSSKLMKEYKVFLQDSKKKIKEMSPERMTLAAAKAKGERNWAHGVGDYRRDAVKAQAYLDHANKRNRLVQKVEKKTGQTVKAIPFDLDKNKGLPLKKK